jgi:hypothetical protein
MGNTNPLSANVNLSFLLGWVVANIVGLPALLLPYPIGFYLLGSLSIIGDGMPIEPMGYVFIFTTLAFSGALLGAWLGWMQSLPLKTQIVQRRKWIGASSLGMAIGAPIGELTYIAFLESPIVNGPDVIYSIYFSDVYAYLIFGVVLGLTIGIAQWSVLRQQGHGAGWWMIVLPVCFALGVWFTNFYLSNTQELSLFAAFSPLTALVGIGCITGILLRWLLQLPEIQREGQ